MRGRPARDPVHGRRRAGQGEGRVLQARRSRGADEVLRLRRRPSHIPTMDLDEAYADADTIAKHIQDTLQTQMADYGYAIIKALITNIEPDQRVKDAMNNINAARRNQEAATAQGEGDKTLRIKKAEGESESMRLHGEGVAAEREAIATGLKKSLAVLADERGIDPKEAMALGRNWVIAVAGDPASYPPAPARGGLLSLQRQRLGAGDVRHASLYQAAHSTPRGPPWHFRRSQGGSLPEGGFGADRRERDHRAACRSAVHRRVRHHLGPGCGGPPEQRVLHRQQQAAGRRPIHRPEYSGNNNVCVWQIVIPKQNYTSNCNTVLGGDPINAIEGAAYGGILTVAAASFGNGTAIAVNVPDIYGLGVGARWNDSSGGVLGYGGGSHAVYENTEMEIAEEVSSCLNDDGFIGFSVFCTNPKLKPGAYVSYSPGPSTNGYQTVETNNLTPVIGSPPKHLPSPLTYFFGGDTAQINYTVTSTGKCWTGVLPYCY